MAGNTAGFPFEIDTTTDIPLWVQLRKRLVHLINTGFYKPGDQLPTVRGLASELAINYNTVNKAYLSMTHDGYIKSTRGRGVFVCELEFVEDNASTQEAALLIGNCIMACRDLGLDTDEIRLLMTRKLQASEKSPSARPTAGEDSALAGTSAQLRVLEGSGRLPEHADNRNEGAQ